MEKTAQTRFARLAVALALTLAPAAAHAQSKADALLGGPSRLAMLVAQQNRTPLQTAAYYPARSTRPVVFRNAIASYWKPAVSPAVALDRPNVFGSVALAIPRSPLDNRWRRVERSRVAGAPAAFAAALRNHDPLARLDAVNRYVNARVAFTDDSRQYRTEDRWAPVGETLRRGRGDCEDYAIAKLQMLRAAGFSDSNLYFVIVKDVARRADHAVLVARAEGRMLLLDNGTDRITDAAAAHDYRPIFSFAAGRVWTHGYQRALPPVSAAPVITASLDLQRSRSASLRALSTGFNR